MQSRAKQTFKHFVMAITVRQCAFVASKKLSAITREWSSGPIMGVTIVESSNTGSRELTTDELEAVSGGYPTGALAAIGDPVLTEEIGYAPSPLVR
jgi:hypothetical protein